MTPDSLRAEMRASVPAPFDPDRVADRLIARGMHLREAPKPDADYHDTLPTVASIDSMAPHAPVTTSERDEAALGGNRYTLPDLIGAGVCMFLLGITLAAGGVL